MVVSVAVEKTNFSFDKLFDYRVPDRLVIEVGDRVAVPFGTGKTLRSGVVFDVNSVDQTSDEAAKLKFIAGAAPREYSLSRENIETARFIKKTCLCCFFDAAKLFFPPLDDAACKHFDENGFIPPKKRVGREISKTVHNIIQTGITLSDKQADIYSKIAALISTGKSSGSLLYGITGSGKTLIFAKLIEFTLNLGKNCIMLVPEIALTPQLLERFIGLFGETVSVIHSGLTPRKRTDEYFRIKSGQARIVIGTRSAVFAPLCNIGLIICDEENEHTYISEKSPKINAKEVAKKRCVESGGAVLFASATPSLESFFAAQNGKLNLFTLTERYQNVSLPDVQIIDILSSGYYNDSVNFTPPLVDEINYNLSKSEQTVLLLNRRGFNTIIICKSCKKALSCPHCSVALTYHKKDSHLKCHECGFITRNLTHCPDCNGETLTFMGTGTQRIEEELKTYFPDARILRMDADSITNRSTYAEKFKAFGEHKYDIMLGTQMIAKGLDFPNVTLAAVISADGSLFAGDFRAYERTFALLTQLTGRAGRAEKPGRALIQTYQLDHYIIRLAANADFPEFYKEEIRLRKTLLYPPFCDICGVEFSSNESKKSELASLRFLEMINEKIAAGLKIPLRILGPVKSYKEKLNDKFRFRILIKCRINDDFRQLLTSAYKETYSDKTFCGVSVSITLNGDFTL
ncbi:MAG: primosomal protein N' [Ruminococcus sp.]|jgi:primosomal protein N' (replication factor Y)|nr:primosomal protein N' [Ruminococcus sp.]